MPLPLHVCTIGRFNPVVGMTIFSGTEAFSTVAWPANNLAIYTPLSLPAPFRVARFMVANGNNNTGTMDVGIYTQA